MTSYGERMALMVDRFQAGREAGLDALERLDAAGADNSDGLAGLVTIVMLATYAMAPTEEMAEEMITFCQRRALENWEKEKDNE